MQEKLKKSLDSLWLSPFQYLYSMQMAGNIYERPGLYKLKNSGKMSARFTKVFSESRELGVNQALSIAAY